MIKNFQVLRTPFIVDEAGVLKQVLTVQVDNSGPSTVGQIAADLSGSSIALDLPSIGHGLNHLQVAIPELSSPVQARFSLTVGAERSEVHTILEPSRRWKIYLVPFSHHDLGYTDQPEVCIDQHRQYFNKIVEYCRWTDEFPDESRFRWTCDTTWALKYYLERADDRTKSAFLNWVRDGRIEITALYAAFNSALLTHEELVRSIYYAHELARQYAVEITSGMTTDIPGNPWGLVQVLARSGTKYLSTAVNQNWSQDGVARAKVPRISRPFYWTSPEGSRLLVWNSDPECIYGEGRHLGFTDSERQVYERLPAHLRTLEESGYPFDAIHLRTTCKTSDNAPPCVYMSEIVRSWNARWAFPKLIIATNSQFFRYMEDTYADQFPEYDGDWTDWWIDGPGSSAYETGVNRVMHEVLATAEKLAAICSMVRYGYAYPGKQIECAYDNLMLYDEHTWGMWNNVSDPYLPSTREHWVYKAAFADEAASMSRGLADGGIRALGQTIATGTSPRIAVFNPLSWQRTDVATVTIDDSAPIDPSTPLRLVSETGSAIPVQIVESHQGRGGVTAAFLAKDVPSLGYRTFRVDDSSAGELPEPSAKFGSNVLENRFYQVTLDPRTGGIASLIDKELGVELVDQDSEYRLNQYVYDSGEPPINGRFSPEAADIYPGAQGPIYSSLVSLTRCGMGKHVRLADPHWGKGKLADYVTPWIKQEVILYEDLKRVDLVNRLYKEETLEKEGVYYAFPFGVKDGQFRLEIAGAVMRPGIDQLPDSGHDWHSVGYWLDILGPEYGVTWSSREVPVVSIGDINTGKWQTSLDLSNSSFFAYAMNNYWTTNFKESQGGDFTFRFSLTSHGGDWDNARAARFGWGYCTDTATALLPAGQPGRLRADAASFCELDRPNVMAFTLKRAEDGDGLILRLLELLGQQTAVKVTFPGAEVGEAYRTDIVERNTERLKVVGNTVEFEISGFGIETIRVKM